MAHLLIVNPNTSAAVTQLLATRAAALAPPQGVLRAATAAFGASYIVDERSAAIAAHAVLDAVERDDAGADGRTDGHVDGHTDGRTDRRTGARADAVLIGCFGDPGLLALRDDTTRPVTGLAEAALRAGAAHGRFAVVTGGARWRPMLQRLAWSLDLLAPLAEIVTVEASGAELAADPARALVLLEAACHQALRAGGVDCLVLGGAALGGMAAQLQPKLPVPLIDSVDAGLRAGWALAVGARQARAPVCS